MKSEEVQGGFTKYTFLAILYASTVLQSAIIYLSLTTGQLLIGASVYLTILLFVEMAQIMRVNLTQQEVAVMYMTINVAAIGAVGAVASESFFLPFVQRSFYVTSPISKGFGLNFPSWYAPSSDSQAHVLRTLMHPDWLIPILIMFAVVCLTNVEQLVLGLVLSNLYIEVEKLPFPMQQVEAAAITTLAQRKKEKMDIFIPFMLIGVGYAFFAYGLPAIVKTMVGVELRLIPLPWADLTFAIENAMPGAIFGISTELLTFTTGFVVPFYIVVSMFIGSIALHVFGNWITLMIPSPLFRLWQEAWLPGMNLNSVYQYSLIYIWMGVIIGLGVAAALGPLILQPKTFISFMRGITRTTGIKEEGVLIDIKKGLLLWGVASAGSIAIAYWMAPDFPLWGFIFLTFIWTLLYTMMNCRSGGLTGQTMMIPYFVQALYVGSGYRGQNAFYVPHVVDWRGAGWVERIKLCKMTGTNVKSLIKAFFVALIIGWLTNFIFISKFWTAAPMPSSVYPYTEFSWPVGLIGLGIWASGRILSIDPIIIGGSFLALFGIQALVTFLHLPFSTMGFALGATSPPPVNVSMLIGALLGKFILSRRFGEEWWKENRTLIVAGIAAGEAIMITISAALMMISTAMWVSPY